MRCKFRECGSRSIRLMLVFTLFNLGFWEPVKAESESRFSILNMTSCLKIWDMDRKPCLDVFFDRVEKKTSEGTGSYVKESPWNIDDKQTPEFLRIARSVRINQLPGGQKPSWSSAQCHDGREHVRMVGATQKTFRNSTDTSERGTLVIECLNERGKATGLHHRVDFERQIGRMEIRRYTVANVNADGELKGYEIFHVDAVSSEGVFKARRSKRVSVNESGGLVIEHMSNPACFVARWILKLARKDPNTSGCDPEKEILSYRDEEHWCPMTVVQKIKDHISKTGISKKDEGETHPRTDPTSLGQCRKQPFQGGTRVFMRSQFENVGDSSFLVLEDEVFDGSEIRRVSPVVFISPVEKNSKEPLKKKTSQ